MKFRHIWLAMPVLAFVLPVSAQDLATITGAVTDPKGAAIPNAQITVANQAVGFTRVYQSNDAGEYTAARIPFGQYVVTAVVSGFETLRLTGITLDAGQTLRVDLPLKVGSQVQEVTVQGNVPTVETDTAAISSVITGRQISELSIPSRNFVNLALLIPGAAPLAGGFDQNSVSDLASDTLPVNGLPGNMNNWEFDGINNVDQGSGSDSLQVFPSLDSLAEFRVSTSNYSAEYAKSGSAMIEVVSKSGTDQFHGSAFEFIRNNALNATDWFLRRADQPKAPLKHNDFGFTIGGPVFIPGHYNTNRQKTFFFLSEEWRRYRDGTVINAKVPSTRERTGDFSECDPASPNYNEIVASGCQIPDNPSTGLPYPNDIVPVDHSAQTLLDALVPLPNVGPITYTKAPSLPTNFREDGFRVDHNFSETVRLFVRYTQDAYTQEFEPTLWTASNFGTVKTPLSIPAKNAVAHLTTSFKPNLLNEVILGFSTDHWTANSEVGADSVSGSITKPSGFGIASIFPAAASGPLLPAISVSGGGPSFAEDTGYPYAYSNPATTVKDNLVWTRGKHNFKFGAFFLFDELNHSVPNGGFDSQGTLSFSNSSSVTTGNALADMFLGRIGSYTQTGLVTNGQLVGGFTKGHYRQKDFEPYVQDDWRVTSKLTLNMGLRYYYVTPWVDHTTPTVASIFIPSQYSAANQAQLDANGNLIQGSGANWLNYGNGLVECGTQSVPKGCMTLPHRLFSPRFGFSYDPFGTAKMVFRGGYAYTYDTSNAHMTASGRYGNPPVIGTLSAYDINGYANVVPGALPPVFSTDVPLHQNLPQIQHFSLGIQRELFNKSILTISYVGTTGRHLQRVRNINQIPVGVGTENVPALAGTTGCDSQGNCDVQDILINTLQPSIFFAPYRGYTQIYLSEAESSSNYNSLQLDFRHNVGHGLLLQAFYTWSHALDDVFGGGGTGAYSAGVDDADTKRFYGTSSLNQAQAFTMNYVYSIPLPDRVSNRALRYTLGGWQLSGVTTFSLGPPINTFCGIAGMSSGIGGNVLCNPIGKLNVKKGVVDDPEYGPTPSWFDPSHLGQITVPQLRADNEPGMFGYLNKNPIRGPGRNNFDVGLTKNFPLPFSKGGETPRLQFRWETFNTFNHPQWSAINFSCSSLTDPGAPCNGDNNIGNGEVAADYGPRVMQIGLRLVY
jgi:Carboxypeptidase regulatory-like domain